MVNASISESVSSEIGRRIQPTSGYYRRSDGWITVSPITQTERIKYIDRGWTHLPDYPPFDMSPYVNNHPFEALFMFGGAHEMSVDQLLQTGLYMNPPLVPTCRESLTQFHRAHNQNCWRGAKLVEFPQMVDVAEALIGPFPCDFCDRNLPTVEGRDQHQSVVHKERLGDMQTGKSLGTSLAEALGNISLGDGQDQLRQRIAELESQLETKVDSPEIRQPVSSVRSTKIDCGCGGSYKPGQGQKPHERGGQHQEWAKTLVVGELAPDPTERRDHGD